MHVYSGLHFLFLLVPLSKYLLRTYSGVNVGLNLLFVLNFGGFQQVGTVCFFVFAFRAQLASITFPAHPKILLGWLS